MSDKPKRPQYDPKYSGWPGPEAQADLEEAIAEAPKPKKKKPVVEEAAE